MPDICCNLDGSDYFFELAEVVPQVQAQALSTKGIYSSAFPDPDELGPHAMVNILRQKQNKKHETGESLQLTCFCTSTKIAPLISRMSKAMKPTQQT